MPATGLCEHDGCAGDQQPGGTLRMPSCIQPLSGPANVRSWNTEISRRVFCSYGLPNFTQFRFCLLPVLRTHSQQDLLSRREILQCWIGKFVQHPWLHQYKGLRDIRRCQQVIDHLDKAIIEIAVRITQCFVLLLQ